MVDTRAKPPPSSSSGGIPEAPKDGTTYGRCDAAWEPVAPLASPSFSGAPQAPTPATTDNSTRVATTAFVQAAIAAALAARRR